MFSTKTKETAGLWLGALATSPGPRLQETPTRPARPTAAGPVCASVVSQDNITAGSVQLPSSCLAFPHSSVPRLIFHLSNTTAVRALP